MLGISLGSKLALVAIGETITLITKEAFTCGNKLIYFDTPFLNKSPKHYLNSTEMFLLTMN